MAEDEDRKDGEGGWGFGSDAAWSMSGLAGAGGGAWVHDSGMGNEFVAPGRVPGGRGRVAGLSAEGDWLMLGGRTQEALRLYREAVALDPARADLHCKLAMAAGQASQFWLSERHFREAVRLDPYNPYIHEAMSQWHHETGNAGGALLHSAEALRLAPGDPHIMISRAVALGVAGQPREAWGLIESLLARSAASVRAGLVCAWLARELGQEKEALDVVEAMVRSGTIGPAERRALEFAAAQLMDGMGRHAEALARATAAKRASDPGVASTDDDDWSEAHLHYFTAEKTRQLPRARHGSRRPVFIVGMPRSGTSLVEQILASHSDVYGAGELRLVTQIAVSLASESPPDGRPFAGALDRLSSSRADELAREYLGAIGQANASARYVLDKKPQNFLHLGLIQLLFPGSRVIHCVRDPLDTCVSCFMTFFGASGGASVHAAWNWGPARSLRTLGRFYRNYRRLMRHWNAVLEVPIMEVRYEEVVRDLEGQTRRLLAFLDLPWEDGCLRFYENRRTVNTPSHDQVRRPVYGSSVGRWRRYEPHLDELKEALGSDRESQS